MGCYGYICRGCGSNIRGDYHDGGERAVMIHVRHGKELGRVEGHYDEYGGVVEQREMPDTDPMKWEGDVSEELEDQYPNCHMQIHHSIFNCDDSYYQVSQQRVYKGQNIDILRYCTKRVRDDLEELNYDVEKLPYLDELRANIEERDPNMSSLVDEVLEESDGLKALKDPNSVDALKKQFSIDTLMMIILDISRPWETSLSGDFSKLPEVSLTEYSGVVAYHSLCYRRAMRQGTFSLIPSEHDPDQSLGYIRKKYMK